MKARIYVTLKKSIADPQGNAIQNALQSSDIPMLNRSG